MRFSANASEPAPETEAEAAGLPDASIIKCDSCKIVCELCKNKTLFKTQQCFHRSARAGTSISVHNAVASRQGRRSDHLAIADTNRWMLSRCACAAWILNLAGRGPPAQCRAARWRSTSAMQAACFSMQAAAFKSRSERPTGSPPPGGPVTVTVPVGPGPRAANGAMTAIMCTV